MTSVYLATGKHDFYSKCSFILAPVKAEENLQEIILPSFHRQTQRSSQHPRLVTIDSLTRVGGNY